MGYSISEDKYNSPRFDYAPPEYYINNILDYLFNDQSNIFAYWNTTWNLHLTVLQDRAKQFIIGEPQVSNARTIFALHKLTFLSTDQEDVYELKIFLFFTTGNVQLPGTAANRFAPVKISDDYMLAIATALQIMPSEKIVGNWPRLESLPRAEITIKSIDADSDIIKEINPTLGVKGGIEIDLRIDHDLLEDRDGCG